MTDSISDRTDVLARNQINDWIRTSGAADGVVDFHAALRDPSDPDRLRPEFDSGATSTRTPRDTRQWRAP